MFRVKAIAAVALGGLGSATMGADMYMASHTKAPPPNEVVLEQPIQIRAIPEPVVKAPAPEPVLMLPPVTLYARDRSRHAARQAAPVEEPKEQGLVACSDWRSLQSGPEARGVRTLCTPSSGGTP
jgi:hypothetical protein